MSVPLLKTKLYIPPVRPNLVSRDRLIERLSSGLERKLTLISAPAGFGKTTLLSECVARCGQLEPRIRVAWLSLDEGDNDLTRFLVYVIAALQTIEHNLGQDVLAALQSHGAVNVEVVLTTLLNELAILWRPDPGKQRAVLVLDDYHVIESRPIDEALDFILTHLPSQLHLVIATRADPNIHLARLRARGQLNELRAEDLRFTIEEASCFY